MPSIRSESRQAEGSEAWALALLVAATLFLTSQAMVVGVSGRLLVAMLITTVLTVWALKRLAGWHGIIYLKPVLLMLLLGQLGMLLGAAMDFGAAGLVMLAGWCGTLGGSGLGSLWGKFGIAPWSYAGMLIGCNLGMLLSGCHNRLAMQQGMPPWLLLSLSNLGMLLGLLAIEAWQPVVSGSLQQLAVLMVVQMLLAMATGMVAIWWLAARLNPIGRPGIPSMPGGGE